MSSSRLVRVLLTILRRLRALRGRCIKGWWLLWTFLSRQLRMHHTISSSGGLKPYEGPRMSSPPRSYSSGDGDIAACETVCPSLLPTSASHPDLRRFSTSAIPDRPASIVALPAHRAIDMGPPDAADTSSIAMRSFQDVRFTAGDEESERLARDRLAVIQAEAQHDIPLSLRASRSPARQALSGPTRASSRNRSKSRSRVRPPSSRHSSTFHLNVRSDTPTPSISLEPPSPLDEKAPSSSVGLSVCSPSTESIPISMLSTPAPSEPLTRSTATPIPIEFPKLPPGRVLREIASDGLPRYSRTHEISGDRSQYTVPALCTHFPHSPALTPGEWMPVTHPEGALYFYHTEKRIYTEVYMYEPNHREEVEVFAQYLEDFLHAMGRSLPSDDCELVLEVSFTGEESEIVWSYYYVDHRTKKLFWLRPFIADEMVFEVLGISSPDHFKHVLESHYWGHWSLFPSGLRDLPGSAYEELIGVLAHACIDSITSITSTAPYAVDDLQRMITLVKRAQDPGAGAIYMTCAVTRLMSNICHYRFIHFHGQRGARLNRDQSIHGPLHKRRTWLMNTFSPLLFLAPNVHLKDIEKVFVDSIIVMSSWKTHMTKLQDEWTEFILYATVLLNANVAFLAIPNVIIFPDTNPPGGSSAQPFQIPLRSPAAIASYLSMVASVGTIILGLLLMRQTRLKNRDDAAQAADYMSQLDTDWFGHEPLAIIYSLPYALLMWAMISFLVGVMIFCFKDTDAITRASVGAIAVAVGGLIVWCILSAWETRYEGALDIVDHVAEGLRHGPRRLVASIVRFWEKEESDEPPQV